MKEVYTINEIKRAFWEQFHHSGELWFPYWNDEEEQNEAVTESFWQTFYDELKEAKGVEESS